MEETNLHLWRGKMDAVGPAWPAASRHDLQTTCSRSFRSAADVLSGNGNKNKRGETWSTVKENLRGRRETGRRFVRNQLLAFGQNGKWFNPARHGTSNHAILAHAKACCHTALRARSVAVEHSWLDKSLGLREDGSHPGGTRSC